MNFIPSLQSFLLKEGAIYTVRRFSYSVSHSYSPNMTNVPGVGRCQRSLIRRVRGPDELVPYVAESGFASVEEWWKKIKSFIKPGQDMFLLKVVVKR